MEMKDMSDTIVIFDSNQGKLTVDFDSDLVVVKQRYINNSDHPTHALVMLPCEALRLAKEIIARCKE